ncbi:MAG: DUF3846 domain-containing protein [Eubacteriales bacterium]|nr:DUF3846 domain-containing protein [Eubacteriales bacterium]
MKISIYQINMERDENCIAFMDYEHLNQFQGSPNVNGSIYDPVFSGEVNAENLEGVYRIFNTDLPDGYHARSPSVSDVVEVKEAENVESGFYFCDSFGFKKIDFDPPEKLSKETIRVLLVEPGNIAKEANIGAELEDMQAVVGGMIEQYCPFEDHISIICDEEGKVCGKNLNRAVYDSDGQMIEIMAGTFFICASPPDSENFKSLSDEQLHKYMKLFRYPEQFFRIDGEIKAMKYNPEKNKNYER